MTAIEFENISKQYRLGLVSTKTLSHDLNRWWQTSILGKEDPYLKIGETNDRATKGESEYVWALKEINFKVEQGDVVGIIGKNGAGKSTLLKLLSRVTSPTTGSIRARGRIASLLEVGTGFHPEMTGRENIYLNGAIMGMTKAEIDRKLDEIVDFSGCERYLDTPVKRYSSGMTVRLGFAVAAHLDPEILVVDEVLAVGDAEFQKKAIGKMQDVSRGEGRTVLFVSHNMASIGSLCKHCTLLENGMIKAIGDTADIVSMYVADNYQKNEQIKEQDILIKDKFAIRNLAIIQETSKEELYQGQPWSVVFEVENKTNTRTRFVFNMEIKTSDAYSVTCFGNEFQNCDVFLEPYEKKQIVLHINELLLKQGTYYLSPYFLFECGTEVYDKYVEYARCFVVQGISPIYLINEERDWRTFPTRHQHGFLSQKVDDFVINALD